MCLGIAGRVVQLQAERPDIARVDVEGVVRDINIALLDAEPPVVGEWILIHLGFALEKMSEEEAVAARSTLAVLGEGLDAEGVGDFFTDEGFRDDPFAPSGYGEVSR